MDDMKEKLLTTYPEKYQYENNQHVLTFSISEFEREISRIKNEFNFIMLLDICGVDNIKRNLNKRFASVYHLFNMENSERLRLVLPVDPEDDIPTVSHLWKNASWFEMESWDLLGIRYKGQHQKRLLNHHEFEGHPLRKDYNLEQNQPLGENTNDFLEKSSSHGWSNTALFHPAASGSFRLMVKLEEETVIKTKIEIGYMHRSFEKLCESCHYHHIVPLTNALNHCSSPMNNIGWCKTVEDLMGMDIPDRAKALRMVMAEMARVIDHLLCIGHNIKGMGMAEHFDLCLEACEYIYELYEKLSGSRQNISLIRVGGLSKDLPLGWISDCQEVIKKVNKNISTLNQLLTRSRIWIQRTSVCPISPREAIEWGYTGPCLRACGVNHDLRKVSPYYFYNEVDFEIPLGVNGDSYDRYLIRMEEMLQSLKIIEQLLSNLPQGDVSLQENICLISSKSVFSDPEARDHHIKLMNKGLSPPKKDIYSATEAANGELGFYVISNGEPYPYRVKMRAPCYPLLQSFLEVSRHQMISDAMVNLGSMNIVGGELDR